MQQEEANEEHSADRSISHPAIAVGAAVGATTTSVWREKQAGRQAGRPARDRGGGKGRACVCIARPRNETKRNEKI